MITIQAGYALVVDDEPANRDFVERLLQTASFKVVGASTGAEALKAAKAVPCLALALVDQQLPDATGLEIVAKLRSDNPEAILVMATMHDDRAIIDQAFAAGADVFLVKPHGFMELYRRLKEVDSNAASLRRLIIDNYGPRPYRGQIPPKPAEIKVPFPAPANVTLAKPIERPSLQSGEEPKLVPTEPPEPADKTISAVDPVTKSPTALPSSQEREGSDTTTR